MSERTLRVRTGSRLHFGLMELHPSSPHCYAGLGAMVEMPGLEMELNASNAAVDPTSIPIVECSSALEERVHSVLARVQRLGAVTHLPDSIRFVSELPLHCGLGAGTQTACALALALTEFDRFFEESRSLPEAGSNEKRVGESLERSEGSCHRVSVAELAKLAGRGRRSAIGLQGVMSGGLVLDHGYQASRETVRDRDPAGRSDTAGDRGTPSDEEALAVRSIQVQYALPKNAFHAVLVFSPPEKSYSGTMEASIIDQLGKIANPNQPTMRRLAANAFSAFEENDVARFGGVLDEYMELAATLFAAGQGGMYVSETVEGIVRAVKSVGIHGVGQSSWGPTVFGFSGDAEQAEHSANQLRRLFPDGFAVLTTKVATSGLQMQWR